MKKKNLYRIFNPSVGEYGTVFALCKRCFVDWKNKIEGKIIYEEIGKDTNLPCNECEE